MANLLQLPSAAQQFPSATQQFPSATQQFPSATQQLAAPSAAQQLPSATQQFLDQAISPQFPNEERVLELPTRPNRATCTWMAVSTHSSQSSQYAGIVAPLVPIVPICWLARALNQTQTAHIAGSESDHLQALTLNQIGFVQTQAQLAQT